ncbi:hypothetical protein [Rhodovibrio sodomensis]|nr:hypothetical protein [Rhodovibrio sodomensis]
MPVLLRIAFILTAVMVALIIVGGAGLLLDLAPFEQMVWVFMAALAIATLDFIVIVLGVAAALPRRP